MLAATATPINRDMGRIDPAVADGDGVIERLTDHTLGAPGCLHGSPRTDQREDSQVVLGGDGIDDHADGGGRDGLVANAEEIIAVALLTGGDPFGGVPVECNGLNDELGMFAPALIPQC